jgi:enamine deaminase RidA (YjgF/YER057c/UK114 family)
MAFDQQRAHHAVVPSEMADAVKNLPFSPAHRCGDLLFVSGQVGRDMESGEVLADPEEQYRQAFENLGLILRNEGATFSDVVELVTFHVGFADIRRFVEVQKAYITAEPYPAWTAVGVAALMDPGLVVEIRCTAMPGPPAHSQP